MNKEKLIKALKEAIKFPLRQLVLAIIPVVLAYIKVLPYEWSGMLYGLLAFFDKYLHELWKGEKAKPKGIVPF